MALLEGIVERLVQKMTGSLVASFTDLKSLRVAHSEGDGDEHTKAGLRMIYSAMGCTGQAPVQTLPTTTAQWLLFNPTANAVDFFVDEIDMGLPSGTAGAGGSVLACICGPNNVPATAPVANLSGVVAKNANPRSSRTPKLLLQSNQTLQGTAAGDWFPVAFMTRADTLLGQTVMFGDKGSIRGRIVIPPGCGLALNVISPTGTTPLFAPIIKGREYETDQLQ